MTEQIAELNSSMTSQLEAVKAQLTVIVDYIKESVDGQYIQLIFGEILGVL